MLRGIAIAMALACPEVAFASAAQLRDEASAFAGQPVRLDERLAVPACPAGFSFRASPAPSDRVPDRLEASCPESGWRLWLPLGSAPAALPRRGQALRVMMEGPGYRASVDAVVESANAREGTVLLRNPRSGSRFLGRIQADGQITVNNISGR